MRCSKEIKGFGLTGDTDVKLWEAESRGSPPAWDMAVGMFLGVLVSMARVFEVTKADFLTLFNKGPCSGPIIVEK